MSESFLFCGSDANMYGTVCLSRSCFAEAMQVYMVVYVWVVLVLRKRCKYIWECMSESFLFCGSDANIYGSVCLSRSCFEEAMQLYMGVYVWVVLVLRKRCKYIWECMSELFLFCGNDANIYGSVCLSRSCFAKWCKYVWWCMYELFLFCRSDANMYCSVCMSRSCFAEVMQICMIVCVYIYIYIFLRKRFKYLWQYMSELFLFCGSDVNMYVGVCLDRSGCAEAMQIYLLMYVWVVRVMRNRCKYIC